MTHFVVEPCRPDRVDWNCLGGSAAYDCFMPRNPEDPTAERPVSMGDIAEALGVSMMTVSLALRDKPRVSDKTKERVLAKAEELGYKRDPEVSRLMAYIRKRRTSTLQANLGFLHAEPEPFGKGTGLYLRTLYEGARQRAESMNYALEILWTAAKGMTPRRMTNIMEARGIQGVIIAPPRSSPDHPKGYRLEMDFSKVSGVNIAYGILEPRFSRVATNHYQGTRLALDRMHERGYRRIGLVFEQLASMRIRDLALAAFSAWQYARFGKIRIEPLLVKNSLSEEIGPWLKKVKPDAVFIQNPLIEENLRALGLRVPDDIGVAYLNADFQGSNVAGIVQNASAAGSIAIDHIISQIMARNVGVPDDNVTILVKGIWRDGDTLRA